MNIKCFLFLVSLIFKSQGLNRLNRNFYFLLSCPTCPEKKIALLSNRRSRNTLGVLMSSPLRTLRVSPATSEVIKTDHHPAPSEWSPRGPVPFSANILWAVQDFTSTKENGPVQWATQGL